MIALGIRDISNWLGHLNLPKLSDAACDALNSEITIPEIVDSIRSFMALNYIKKKYYGKLAALLLRMFTRSLETQKLPDTLYNANISLILKEGIGMRLIL